MEADAVLALSVCPTAAVRPGHARCARQILRNAGEPNEVFVMVEFASAHEARAGRDKLLNSGVLDRFEDTTGPKVLEDTEQVNY